MASIPQPLASKPAVLPFMHGTTTPHPRLSVVVPIHNHRAHLEACLEALQQVSEDTEIIVVDDASSEDIQAVTSRLNVRYLRLAQQRGPAAARNAGWRAAQAEIVVFVDSDVVVPKDALPRIRKVLENNPSLAGVFGSYDDEPASCTFYSQFRNLLHHHIHQLSKEDAHTFWTGFGALRKSVLQENAGFDESLGGMDDVELGMRLSHRSCLLLLDKSLQVKHLKEWTLANTLRTDIFLRAVPWTQLLAKANRVPRDLNLGYRARLSAILVMLLFGTVLFLSAYVPSHGWWRAAPIALLATTFAAGLLHINKDFYALLKRKRGLLFAGAAVLPHWLYYFYSTATFLVVWLGEHRSRLALALRRSFSQ